MADKILSKTDQLRALREQRASKSSDGGVEGHAATPSGIADRDGMPARDGRIVKGAGVEPGPSEANPVAKATKGKAGTAGVNGPVRRSTAGTGLRVGEASADLPATSELMDATAGETALKFDRVEYHRNYMREYMRKRRQAKAKGETT